MDQFIFKIEDKDDNSTYILRHCPDGWREYGVSFGREDNVSNVVKSYSGSWSFVKEDGDYIWTKFAKYGPNRRLKLVILSLENGLTETYSTCYVGYLDLTQIERDNNVVNVPVNEGGFFKALENKWSEDYSYPYDRFLRVNGNVFSEEAHFTSPDSIEITMDREYASTYFFVGGQLENKDDVSDTFFRTTNLQWLNIRDTDRTASTYFTRMSENNAFMISRDISKVNRLSFSFDIDFQMHIEKMYDMPIGDHTFDVRFDLMLFSVPMRYMDNVLDIFMGGMAGAYRAEFIAADNIAAGEYHRSILEDKDYGDVRVRISGEKEFADWDCQGSEGCAFYMVLVAKYGNRRVDDNTSIKAKFNDFSLNAGFEMVINAGKSVSSIPAVSVFRNLIGSINNGRYNVDIDTSEFEAVASDDILTSRSGLRRKIALRGRQRYYAVNGYITTNLGAFLSYCYAVYGFKLGVDYDMEADRYRVFLSHVGNMYSKSETVRLERINDVRLSVWRDVLYSSVVIGYEKDENAINGDRDFNCKYTLSTPNTEIERNEMQIVSPYSASSRSFETELYKEYRSAYEEGGEDGSIYLLSGHYVETSNVSGNEIWELSRDIDVTRGSLFPNEEYNVKFSPRRMMLRHAVELNGFFAFEEGKRLFVETCDGNANIVAGGISETHYEYDNASRASYESKKMRRIMYVIGSERVFRPVLISVSSIGDSSIIGMVSSKRLGYVSFSHGGKTFKGYLSHNTNAVTIHPMDEKECEFNLLITEDSYFPQ